MNNRRNKFFFIKLSLITIMIAIIGVGGYTYAARQFNAVVAFNPVLRRAGNTIVNYRTRNYDFIETDNFIIRYDGGISQEILELTKITAEDKYKETVAVFQYEPKNKVVLVLYSDVDELKRNTMMTANERPPMGVYYGDALHILDPTLWIQNQDDIEGVFYSQGPVLHELVHLFTEHVARGNFPMWFTEGVSLYFEYMVDEYEWGKGVEIDQEQYNIHSLTNNFYGLEEYLAYTESFRLMREFVDYHGIDALMEMLRDLGEGKSFADFEHLFMSPK